MNTKKILPLLFIATTALPGLTSCGGDDLSIFNWGEYISQDVVAAFQKEYGVSVKQRTYDSNELMMTKLETQSYDIMFPSEYAVEELKAKDMIQPIDWSKMEFQKDDLVPELKSALDVLAADKIGSKGFDLLQYAVPYTWGEIGVVYNTDKITAEEIKADGWEALRKAKNADGTNRKVAMYNAARDVYSMALIASGLPIVGEISDEQIKVATDWLLEQKRVIGTNLYYKTEELLDEIPLMKYDIAFTYVGDAIYGISEAEDSSKLKFYIPEMKEGGQTRTNIYCDAIVINKNARDVDLAHKFIDFMMRYESAYENTLEIGYTTTHKQVYKDIVADHSDYENGKGSYADVKEAYCFSSNPAIDTFYRYDSNLKEKLENEWIKVSVH